MVKSEQATLIYFLKYNVMSNSSQNVVNACDRLRELPDFSWYNRWINDKVIILASSKKFQHSKISLSCLLIVLFLRTCIHFTLALKRQCQHWTTAALTSAAVTMATAAAPTTVTPTAVAPTTWYSCTDYRCTDYGSTDCGSWADNDRPVSNILSNNRSSKKHYTQWCRFSNTGFHHRSTIKLSHQEQQPYGQQPPRSQPATKAEDPGHHSNIFGWIQMHLATNRWQKRSTTERSPAATLPHVVYTHGSVHWYSHYLVHCYSHRSATGSFRTYNGV